MTIFGKSWLLHVTEILRTTPEENLKMIEDSVRFLTEQGKQVIYDANIFLMDTKIILSAIETLKAARGGL